MLIFLVGCDDNTAPPSTPNYSQPIRRTFTVGNQPRPHEQKEPPILHLSELWGASKSSVSRALHGHELVEDDNDPPDDPDPAAAGGEIRAYSLGGDAELSVTFNSRGRATIVAVDNQKEDESGLGFTLDQWHEAFRRYGLQECGEPAETAPEACYWGPPHNHTGGSEIEVIAYDTGQVWQVQVRSPDEVFPN